MISYSPVIIFAFNRIEPLKACVAALLQNSEAAESDLIVYVDGPRTYKVGEVEKVDAVREFVKTITGFKSLTYFFSNENKKLGPSVIAGVTEVIKLYGRAIVVEDDLIVADNFLNFMNQGLTFYENDSKVFSICGYTNIVKRPVDYVYDAYFCPRSSSWGWATWKDRWDSVDWKLQDWENVIKKAKAFNQWGGSDCFKMLNDWKRGINQSWAIRFCYNQFLQNKLSLFPMKSLVANEGFDGGGTNCKKWSRFRYEMDLSSNKNYLFPKEVKCENQLKKQILWYHSIPLRIWSRVMYILH